MHVKWPSVVAISLNLTLHCDIGVAEVVKLPEEETQRRWRETTPQWPIMHAIFKGVTRDQMMARHKSNHIQVVYTPNEKQAHRAARIKGLPLQLRQCIQHPVGRADVKGNAPVANVRNPTQVQEIFISRQQQSLPDRHDPLLRAARRDDHPARVRHGPSLEGVGTAAHVCGDGSLRPVGSNPTQPADIREYD